MATFRDELELKGDPRRVDDAGVERLDRALAAAAGVPVERVLHAIDPRRVLAFQAGGPPVWSVAVAPCADGGFLFLTYGLSRAVEPDARFEHELSLRAPAAPNGQPPQWPTFLLRQLCRYQITSGRELRVGDPMSFGKSITRAAMAPQHEASMPDSPLTTVAVVADPAIEGARRVVGLRPEEHALAELWSTAGLMAELAKRDPTLETDIRRGSWADDAELRAAVEAGAKREGSQTGAMVIAGLRWREQGAEGVVLRLPGGATMKRLVALIDGRLGFGRNLLLHDFEPAPHSEVGLVPSESDFVRTHGGRMLELGLAPGSPTLKALRDAAAQPDPPGVDLSFS